MEKSEEEIEALALMYAKKNKKSIAKRITNNGY
jgi:hypothetical protein